MNPPIFLSWIQILDSEELILYISCVSASITLYTEEFHTSQSIKQKFQLLFYYILNKGSTSVIVPVALP